tara:strand:- start:3659 stop:4198 length:540 start_codon:yes stop_codon:yes gene_type:complete
MSGTRKKYDLNEKNYFKFFGITEKQNISVRSLTANYKKIITILNSEPDNFFKREKMAFSTRSFETLVDPITRAKYLISLHGHESDVRDSAEPTDFIFVNQLNHQFEMTSTVEEVNDFILELKNQTIWIKEQIEESIDTYKNYKVAAGLLNRFHEISTIHNKSKEKKTNIEAGITYVIFD